MSIKVLVVDDEPDVAVIFRQKFRRRVASGEIEFQFAENGLAALERVRLDPEISLVFTDIRMPSMDGLTFLKELKGVGRQLLLPIVVSAYDDLPNIREAMRQGAWDFVTKPIDLDDLERVCDKALHIIHERRQGIEAAQRLAQAEQAHALALQHKEAQQTFFENITHELRTPLTLTLSPLASAMEASSEPAVRQFLRLSQQGGHLLHDTIDQLLDFAKADAHRLQPRWEATDVTALLMAIADSFQPVASQRGIRFHHTLASPCTGLMDRRMLTRIVLNLLSNAFKYTPAGGEVSLRLALSGHTMEVRVEDNGPGLPEAETQGHPTRFLGFGSSGSTMAGSSGLGLSICFALAEAMGGKLHLQANQPHGARFSLELALQEADDAAMQGLETSIHNLVSSLNPVRETGAREADGDDELPLVVVAEDHPDMRAYLVQLLQGEFQVVAAEDGRRALERCRALIPDLVLTDWMMPGMDGITLLEIIRQDPDTHHIPVVMLTAKGGVDARLQGIATGSEAFLQKPFAPQELLAVLRGLLAQRERLRERYRAELLHPERHKEASMEDQFVADVRRVMEQHIMDEQFGVETMADALSMSRRTLVRKLTAVTGQPPVKFIRGYRLERAKQMLESHTAPIWEIAVKTGFGSASYFTKCYKDHYGVSPKESVQREG